MKLAEIPAMIARELGVRPQQTAAVIELLDGGNTVPFIARYRKEATGNLDEEQIRSIDERMQYLRNVGKRQEEIRSAIEAQGKLTAELAAAIEAAQKLQELEDLYLPFRPKKRTRAQIAREKGLEPLAERMLAQADPTAADRLAVAAGFINAETGVEDAAAALAGARDIVAETIAERANLRTLLRREIWKTAALSTALAVPDNEAPEFLNYKEYREAVNHMPSHRILAVNRGETKKALKVHFEIPQESLTELVFRAVFVAPSLWQPDIGEAVQDSCKRLLFPAMEREVRSLLTENAEKQAIHLFGRNLRQLLLIPPLAGHTVLGLDPGYRTGCKATIVNPQGSVLDTAVFYLTHSAAQREASAKLMLELIRRHNVTLAAIGNGTASYETEEFLAGLIRDHSLSLHYVIANEAGASVYSASKLAKEELPDLDVTLRGAVSIARRVQDPLAELVKIEPKAIGVGQYQHDVDQKELLQALDGVVESAVNHVGVDLNTASVELLRHVAGIQGPVAKNIVAWRDANGRFSRRKELLKIPRLGPAAFTQCAGFLRIAAAADPLDNTPVHPESYALAEMLLTRLGFGKADLTERTRLPQLQAALKTVDAAALARELNAGEPTVRDILDALAKPGRDPREDLPPPLTRKNIVHLADLLPGTLVKGTVHNVTDFGAFVDIGLKINGLLHRSELSNKPFRHPLDIVSVGDIVEVVILSVDAARNRIALSLKQVPAKSGR
ncbi:MAG: RNA-binding transcriptional accessory protein [Veillonellaceae bacterium]|nr:RNA-binding transcriptional accessory protein [Veillonellaceae bacterium]